MQTQQTILFCGDTFLRTRDGDDPFRFIRQSFADRHVCVNLETSLEAGCRRRGKNVSLSVGEDSISNIPDSVRFISVVNNHVGDCGSPAGLARKLEQLGKSVIGPENPCVTTVTLAGMQVDFFGAYFNLPRLRISYNGPKSYTLRRLLIESRAKRKIVNLHWGYEHTSTPAPFQRELARQLVDAGADIIVGHHPHVPQGWETYKDRYIYYSLGNFNFWQFDGETTNENRSGYMVDYDPISGESRALPYRINDNYQPLKPSPEEEEHLISELQQRSEAISKIDDPKWFATQYAAWYSRERKVWKQRCFKQLVSGLWIKWIAWLCMPLQLKYYGHALLARIGVTSHKR